MNECGDDDTLFEEDTNHDDSDDSSDASSNRSISDGAQEEDSVMLGKLLKESKEAEERVARFRQGAQEAVIQKRKPVSDTQKASVGKNHGYQKELTVNHEPAEVSQGKGGWSETICQRLTSSKMVNQKGPLE